MRIVAKRSLGLLVVAGTMLATGCLSTKSYVDPVLPKVAAVDLRPRANPAPLQLKFSFQTMGKDNLRVTGMVYDKTSTLLRNSGLFAQVLSAAPDTDQLEILMNNVGDIGKAVGKGIGTGLTLGLAGSMVTDGYTFTATFTPRNGTPVRKEYQHALHTTIGNKSGPAGLTPTTPEQGFDQVLRELVMKLLKDLQDENAL